MLSLYSAPVEHAPRRVTSLHVCVTCCHGDLDEGDAWELERKCRLLGASGLLFVLDVTQDARDDEVRREA